MSQKSSPLTISLEIHTIDNEASVRLDQITRQLLREIEQSVRIDKADLKTEKAPLGTRSSEAIAIGMIGLQILPVFVEKLADLVVAWANRNRSKVTLVVPVGENQVHIEYDPTKTTPEDLKDKIKLAVDALNRADEQ